jgi:D-alanyl-D-alanine carboxypeptidase/D-alanyl-D-alanine-endopeptidase (penicillin-binding protein 4)
LLAKGLAQIPGRLLYYQNALDDERVHSTWGDSVLHWYGAPITGLTFNDNCVDITIEPSMPGELADYAVMPPTDMITVVNNCRTGDTHAPTIEKRAGEHTYVIGGTCTRRAELKSKPVDDPGAFFASALRTHLAERGVAIAGGDDEVDQPLGGTLPPPRDSVIAVHQTSVNDLIWRINTHSQNLLAEGLCKLTGQAYAVRQGEAVRGSWAWGAMAARAFLEAHGIDHAGLTMADGSGLSRANRVTARLITEIFRVMYSHPHAAFYRSSLAQGGQSGTIAGRFKGYEGRVLAKTGYIGGVRALSGYVKTDRGDWLAFSFIYNQIPGSVKPYEALQDEAVKLLMQWPDIEVPEEAGPERSLDGGAKFRAQSPLGRGV